MNNHEEISIEQIEEVKIEKLFGRFNYSINLKKNKDGISILTAPNGYGKSTILKIINSFASGDYFYFIREKFGKIEFIFSNQKIIEIIHIDDDIKNNQVTIRSGENQSKIKDPFRSDKNDERSFMIERAFPFLTRVGSKTWRHDRTGEVLDRFEILSRYGDHPIFKRNITKDDWLEKFRESIKVFSISTNRLKSEEDEIRNLSTDRGTLMVDTLAKEIQEKIQFAIRNQFEEGRKRETSFPTRLIESLKDGISPTKEAIIDSIRAVQAYEERYGRLGLLPQTGTTKQLNVHAESTENAGMLVLKTYLDDIREKFSLLENLAERLDIFCRSINELIGFKTIETSADKGIIVTVIDGKKEPLSLQVLSSGEQHLIVLIGKLVFNTQKDSLVLIDEPEISFHPEWQERFLAIIEEIRKLNNFNVLIATHSPILIGDRWDSVIELAEQYRYEVTA